MQKNKILALCVLLLVITAMFSLLFLPRGRTPITFDGKYLGQNEDYMQLRYGSKLIHINIRNHPELPKFYRGDTIEVQYYRSRKNSYGSDGSRYFEEILSIKRRFAVDWGVSLEPAKATPTGILLSMGVDSNIFRRLEISAYSLDVSIENQWQPVMPLTQDHHQAPIAFADGVTVELRWNERYGTLEPGTYRLYATVSCEGEDRIFACTFSISPPAPTTLEETVEQSIQHFLRKEILDPPERSDNFERISDSPNAGTQSYPTLSTVSEKCFDQIAHSYEIYEYKQDGDLHNYKIIGLCRGYNGQIPVAEFGAPIWLTIRQKDATIFDVVSFKMPYNVTWKMMSCPRFPPSARGQIMMLTEFRDRLRAACDGQVIGGVTAPSAKGSFYVYFHEGTKDANTVTKTISSGSNISIPIDEKYIDFTILLGNKIYYVYSTLATETEDELYTVYDVESETYMRMYKEGRKSLIRMIWYNESQSNKIYIDQ